MICERQEERHRVGREIRLKNHDRPRSNLFRANFFLPVAKSLEKPAVTIDLIFPDDGFGFGVSRPDLQQKIYEHHTPPRKITCPVMKSLSGRIKKSIALETSLNSPGRWMAWRLTRLSSFS